MSRTRAGQAAGTVLAVEGGPGYSSIGSRYLYLRMLGSLHATRNLLLIDLRGTAMSTPIHCPALEYYQGVAVGPAFDRAVGACGAHLDHTWRGSGGTWVHAPTCSARRTRLAMCMRC